MRIQKYLSQIGYCSRRQAEALIKSRKLTINGQIAKLGDTIDSNQDEIKINHKIIKQLNNDNVYIALNKPLGYICSNTNRQGISVMDLIHDEDKRKIGHLQIVGRLDKDSEGLVLLTNDGELTNQLTHPRYEHEKEYKLIITKINNLAETIDDKKGIIKIKTLNNADIHRLETGMYIGRGKKVDGIKIKSIKNKQNKIILNVILKEGKNRQLRKMFGRLGYNLLSLKRIRINKLKLGNLKLGKYNFIKKEKIISNIL